MKFIIILFIGLTLMNCLELSATESMDAENKIIRNKNVAVILVDFPDTPDSVKIHYPTIEEAQEYFCGELITSYFSDISYNKFDITGQVFGYFTMPVTLTEDLRNNDEIINITDLIVPHPRIQERRFVLEPLNEVMSNYVHPLLQKKISTLLEECADNCMVKKVD